jgi:hypothetical protein
MKTIQIYTNRRRRVPIEVPESWDEAHEMLIAVMDRHFDKRGGNAERMSVCARVAFGMFGERFIVRDPTITLVYLLQIICKRKGAGLDA